MKILTIDTRLRWKILKGERFVGVCDRLKLTAEADSLEKLIVQIHYNMDSLFKDLYNEKELNDFNFQHSIAYKIEDYDKFVDIAPLPIIV